MIKTVIVGAAGRMGKTLIQQVVETDSFGLAGAIEYAGSSCMGEDAGIIAGCGEQGIVVSADLETALQNADVIIDFSTPEQTLSYAETAVNKNCGVVIGTTGMSDDDRQRIQTLTENSGRIVMAPNMSTGINLLFYLCDKVAGILGSDYDKEVIEAHHNRKKDAPSGTARRMGEIMAEATALDYRTVVRHGREGETGARTKEEIGMHAVRAGDIVGEHTALFAGAGERIELTHRASSRATFAQGALRAAAFVVEAEPGLYDMQDVLHLR
ncbi:MAG: 4-hydroxy-tetrahydrodipicolinate reductase [Lentisphaeria bacterium]